MAERPVFVPAPESKQFVSEIFIPLQWHSGFAASQKAKNIAELHANAAKSGLSPLLEISSKSENKRGRHLSAFHMTVATRAYGKIPLECAFQGSKVFQSGGPFTDIYGQSPREAKKDPRLRNSGSLVGFQFEGVSWPLEPKTVFYDWLYINFLSEWRDWAKALFAYAGFTDIEFNPHKSINCQARSCALFLSMLRNGSLDEALQSPSDFVRILLQSDYRPDLRLNNITSRPEHPALIL